jgi:N-succinyldiaminopimelate aminotransferase
MQYAAVDAMRALVHDSGYRNELLDGYRERRTVLVNALSSAGFDVFPPAGAFFVCAGFSRLGFGDDVSLCRALVTRARVAAIPPSAFFEQPGRGASYVRFVFCKRLETLEEAARRLVSASLL